MRLSRIMCSVVMVVLVSGCATRGYVDEQVAALEARQEVRIEEMSVTASQALDRATQAGVLAQGKFLYSVVFTEDNITFSSSNATLSDAGKVRLTELANGLMDDNQSVYLEIQGHTDATGSATFNQQLGLARAEAVRRYLHSQGVALDRMSTISYGEDAPAAANDTPEGRAMNRRVEVVVMN